MMADTILLAMAIMLFLLCLVYIFLKRNKFSKKRITAVILSGSAFVLLLFLFTGVNKIKSDISRIIHNSGPKSSYEVYNLLFKKSIDSCMTVINFKDQEIPKIDCCIWMEVRLCPAELARIISLKKYQPAVYTKADSIKFLNDFSDRPYWWRPQA
jgi:glucan phosphoethanolaminetransferase (alkaline phosphatase superfamily)